MQTNTAHRITKAEIVIAKETDLPDLLSSLGYQVKRIGNYHTTKEMNSLRIKDRRTWFRYSEGIGGDAISFLRRFENKSFPEAVEYLLSYQGRSGIRLNDRRSRCPRERKAHFNFPLPARNSDECSPIFASEVLLPR